MVAGIGVVRLSRLQEVRRQKFLSQDELAKRAGVSKNTIHRLENGLNLAQGRTLRRLAEALEVEPSDLVEPAPPQSA
jgi:transcriptional regulator with XRE-family HTH domain